MLEGSSAVHIFSLIFVYKLARLNLLRKVLTLFVKHPDMYSCQYGENKKGNHKLLSAL